MDNTGDSSAEPSPPETDPTRHSAAGSLARMVAIGSLTSVQRGVAGVIVGGFLLLWPDVVLSLAVAIVGAVVAVLGAVGLARGLRRRRSEQILRSLIDVGYGAALVLVSSFATSLIAAALGIGLAVRGVLDGARAVRAARSGQAWVWSAVRGFAQIVTGIAVGVLGEGVVVVILLLVGVTWLLGGALTIALVVTGNENPTKTLAAEMVIDGDSTGDALSVAGIERADATHQQVMTWFQQQDVGPEARQDVVDKLVFEGQDFNRRVARYASLMAFATAIAALGIQTDSTAVVIGAMLVAPLMTPIMATSLSLVLGLPRRAARSLGLVGGGVLIAVAFSFFIARYVPEVVELGANSQIAARTAPTLLDLLIALAAGFAGGYAVCRPDVSDSLPGVAIAVALVPPLAVVGITLAAGEFGLASGAFLLFLTNLVGIIIASGLMFATTGVAPWNQLSENADQLRRTSLTVLAALVLVSIPLAITGQRILADAANRNLASSTTQEWLDELLGEPEGEQQQLGDGLRQLEVVQVGLDGDVVQVVLIGDKEINDATDLADRLTEALGDKTSLQLRIIPETRITVEPDSN